MCVIIALIQAGIDCLAWINDAYLFSDDITDTIVMGIYDHFNNIPPADMVGFAYSGSGDPLIQALNKRHELDMKTVVLVGTPLRDGSLIGVRPPH